MIQLLGLMDVHSFDGSGRGLFVLAAGPAGEFRFPVDENQAAILLSQFEGSFPAEEEEEHEEVQQTIAMRRPTQVAAADEDRLDLPGFRMGMMSDRDQDDDL